MKTFKNLKLICKQNEYNSLPWSGGSVSSTLVLRERSLGRRHQHAYTEWTTTNWCSLLSRNVFPWKKAQNERLRHFCFSFDSLLAPRQNYYFKKFISVTVRLWAQLQLDVQGTHRERLKIARAIFSHRRSMRENSSTIGPRREWVCDQRWKQALWARGNTLPERADDYFINCVTAQTEEFACSGLYLR